MSTHTVTQLVLTALVVLWSARLALFLFKRIKKYGKDSRFDKFRDDLLELFLVYNMSVRGRCTYQGCQPTAADV